MLGAIIIFVVALAATLAVALWLLTVYLRKHRPASGWQEWIAGSQAAWKNDELSSEALAATKPQPAKLSDLMNAAPVTKHPYMGFADLPGMNRAAK